MSLAPAPYVCSPPRLSSCPRGRVRVRELRTSTYPSPPEIPVRLLSLAPAARRAPPSCTGRASFDRVQDVLIDVTSGAHRYRMCVLSILSVVQLWSVRRLPFATSGAVGLDEDHGCGISVIVIPRVDGENTFGTETLWFTELLDAIGHPSVQCVERRDFFVRIEVEHSST